MIFVSWIEILKTGICVIERWHEKSRGLGIMTMSVQILAALATWIPDSDVYSDDECPVTERCPVSSAPASKSAFTIEGVTVMAYNRADAVALAMGLY